MKQKICRSKRVRVRYFSPTKTNFIDGRKFIRAWWRRRKPTAISFERAFKCCQCSFGLYIWENAIYKLDDHFFIIKHDHLIFTFYLFFIFFISEDHFGKIRRSFNCVLLYIAKIQKVIKVIKINGLLLLVIGNHYDLTYFQVMIFK